jgi:2-polyprenyl-3-methyl-5-hydroxy-6-metoxy-1,4-benzoquinol methylase
MKTADFKQYKAQYRTAIRSVLSEAQTGILDEAAFPAYSHPNPLINWIFWQRLRLVMNYLERNAPYERLLDFGCGSGVMLPFLASISQQVSAVDVDVYPIQMIQKYLKLPKNIDIYDISKIQLDSFQAESFDAIIALDVLEHVDDLPRNLSILCKLLKPGGQLVVSGPTENIIYRLGRKIAGSEYSGDYHERDVSQIRKELAKIAKIQHIATIYHPFPLFEIFTGIV